MRVFATDEGLELDLRGHILVLPGCDSLAHLGELCVDALVHSFGLRRVAVVESRHLLPVAMASAWELPGKQQGAGNALTTAAEIYQSEAVPNLSVLQLRSAVAQGRRQALVRELWVWACAQGVAEVIAISSCSSHVKVDADLAARTDLRYVFIGASSVTAAELGLGPNALPLSHGLSPEDLDAHENREVAAVLRFLRGGGLARPLLLHAAEVASTAKPAGDGQEFAPPPRIGSCPSVLGLLGLTSEALDFQLTEQLAHSACAVLACRLKMDQNPTLKPPPSWLYELEAAAPERRLWT